MDKNSPVDDTRLDTFFSDKNFEKEYFYGKKEWMNETSNLLK